MRVNTIKYPKVSKQENLSDFVSGKDFLNRTQKALSIKEKIVKLHFIKVKSFCSPKTLLQK